MPSPLTPIKLGVVGATGMVGGELLSLLESRHFPVAQLFPFSSGKAGARIYFKGRAIAAPKPDFTVLSKCDLVFFVSADEVSEKFAPRLAQKGVWVIDDSAAFRQDPKVPLIIPEINALALRQNRRLIAGPNCTMVGLAVAAYPLHKIAPIKEVRLASYQSVSGAGKAALSELFTQSLAMSKQLRLREERAPILKAPKASALPRPIAFNVIPQVGSFGPGGISGEESKVAAELRKVWRAPRLPISVTAVRVPVSRGHSLSAWVRFNRPMTPQEVRRILAKAPGICLTTEGTYPTPLDSAGKGDVFVGRIRQGNTPNEIVLWIVSDNLLKGAAYNSLQIAQELLSRGWL